ncbi:receptor-transporting protein 4 [Camelus dromedarius]|uniref:receptor-transporting protein 4 n=1 Tax=Camelus dromedarius TaxID=9838 RepID=UPI00311963BF
MDSKPQSKTMALDVRTWEQIFQELIWQEKPRARWTLKLDGNLKPDCVAPGWKQYRQRGFGRFQCSSCQRRWASAQVQILCHMKLEPRKSQGQVLMRTFAQRCRKCSRSQFEKPEFSLDSTQRILNNLVQHILEKFYRNGVKVSEIPVKLEVPLDGSHDTANCEACTLGFCMKNLQNCMTEPSKSPLSHMEIRSSSDCIGDVCGQNLPRNRSAEAKETQGSGYSCAHKGSRPSHAAARTQVPGADPQPKGDTGQLLTPGADRQATRGTGPQSIRVARLLPSEWTDPQPIQEGGPLPAGWGHSQSTLGTGPKAPWKTYSQAVRMKSQQSAQEEQATQGAGLQATRVTHPQPTKGTIPRATSGSDTQATGKAGTPTLGSNPQHTQGAIPKATAASGTQVTGRAGTPTPGSNSQPTQGAIPKATAGLGSQATGRAGTPTPGSNSQPTQGAIPQATAASGTQATGRAGTPTPGSNSQPTQGAIPKATAASGTQATGRAGTPTLGSNSQQTLKAGHKCGPGTYSGTQAAWGRQEGCSPRGAASDSICRVSPSRLPNDSLGQEQLFRLGYVCVVALFTFLVSRYL